MRRARVWLRPTFAVAAVTTKRRTIAAGPRWRKTGIVFTTTLGTALDERERSTVRAPLRN